MSLENVTGVYVFTRGYNWTSQASSHTVTSEVRLVYADGTVSSGQSFPLLIENYGARYGLNFSIALFRPGNNSIRIGSSQYLKVTLEVSSNGSVTVATRPNPTSWYSQISGFILCSDGRIFYSLFEFDGTQSFFWLYEVLASGDSPIVKLSGQLNAGPAVVSGNLLVVRNSSLPNPFTVVNLTTGILTASATAPEAIPLSNFSWTEDPPFFRPLPFGQHGYASNNLGIGKFFKPPNFWGNFVGTTEKV